MLGLINWIWRNEWLKNKKNKKNKKRKSDNIWTEEEYEKYIAGIYGLEYIAGFTDSGVPFGISDEDEISFWLILLTNSLVDFKEDISAMDYNK